ncbi:hypothetical protein K1719_011481 [Acacia pycnantha]|nr:hypothetical protein K1719_011481 [Acacia pycnantha]
MAGTGAAHMVLQSVFNGSISMQDMEIVRRPYHKNCGCALHNLKAICPNFCPLQRLVSFPNKTSFLSQASISATLSTSPSQTTVFKRSHHS